MTNSLSALVSTGIPADYRFFLRSSGLDFDLEEQTVADSDRVRLTKDEDGLTAVGRVSILPWDSAFFGLPTGRFEGMFFASDAPEPAKLRYDLIGALTEHANGRALVHLTCRIRADDLFLAQALEAHEFRLVDIMAIYHCDLTKKQGRGDGVPRPSTVDPEGVLQFLERSLSTMVWGRIFQDPRIDRSTAEQFYLESSRHYLENDAHVSTASDNGRLTGIAIGVIDPDLSTQMGLRYGYLWLILVDPEFRGQGLGATLFEKFCREFAASCDLLEIGTQLGNGAANAMYLDAGCRAQTQLCTFHRWKARS